MATPVIESKAEQKEATNTTSTIITAPTGITDGDLLVICVAVDGDQTASIAAPAGFSTIYNLSNTSLYGTLFVSYKVASGESGNYTVSWAGSEEAYAVMYRISGVDTTTPIQDPNETLAAAASTHTITPVAATSSDNSLVIVVHSGDDNKIQPDLGGDADYTLEDADHNGGGSGGAGLAIQSQEVVTAGTPDACSYTYSTAANAHACWFAVLEGAGGGGGLDYRSMTQPISHSIVRPIST